MNTSQGMVLCPPFPYFRDLAAIPRASGDEDAVRRYLFDFARKNDLSCCADAAGNVLIHKEAAGDQREPLLLQAHLDMVYIKRPGAAHIYGEALTLLLEDGMLRAEDTSLGADNGLGIACILAALAGAATSHPPLYALFTVQEEDGLAGASALSEDFLPAARMINLDAEEEGVLLAGCAGACSGHFSTSLRRESVNSSQWEGCRIALKGLYGGHSGLQIHLWRENAIRLLVRFLTEAFRHVALKIQRICGGDKANVIPSAAQADVLLPRDAQSRFILEKMAAQWTEEYRVGEPQLQILVTGAACEEDPVWAQDAARLMQLIHLMPHGVLAMSHSLPGLVQTSNNLGKLICNEDSVHMECNLRSSVEREKRFFSGELEALARLHGFSFSTQADYPAWEYRAHSALREDCERIYHDMYGHEPEVRAVHCGLECGCFQRIKPTLDMVSIGPTILDVHSTEERAPLPSFLRFWEYFTALLANMK